MGLWFRSGHQVPKDFGSDVNSSQGFEYPRTSAPTWNPLRTEFGTGLNMKKVPGQVYVKKDSDRLGKAKWDFGSDLIPDFHEIGSNSDTNPILQGIGSDLDTKNPNRKLTPIWILKSRRESAPIWIPRIPIGKSAPNWIPKSCRESAPIWLPFPQSMVNRNLKLESNSRLTWVAKSPRSGFRMSSTWHFEGPESRKTNFGLPFRSETLRAAFRRNLKTDPELLDFFLGFQLSSFCLSGWNFEGPEHESMVPGSISKVPSSHFEELQRYTRQMTKNRQKKWLELHKLFANLYKLFTNSIGFRFSVESSWFMSPDGFGFWKLNRLWPW
ncbi:uncharacterized protein OCT59_017234 [Rhizophagus irregularis]|uniref:uncharacterized protein n=1 Tax=Rhizophagus irregularis TaxID=588596 RepID=UPI00332902F7|nr:hypothetical protein OCT59_017234 [Rhizophagus irregularis]